MAAKRKRVRVRWFYSDVCAALGVGFGVGFGIAVWVMSHGFC